VLTLALIKFFVVSSLQSTNTYVFSSTLVNQQQKTAQIEGSFYIFQLTVVTSFLFFGNIIDNTTNHKQLVMLCDFLLGTVYMIYGVLFVLSGGPSKITLAD